MAKKYYRWKNPNCKGINPEWIEMSGKEYYQFINRPENETRRFEVLGNRICKEADILVFEVTEERYEEYSKEHRHERYLDESSKEYSSVSLQDNFSKNEDLKYEEVVSDESIDVENEAISAVNQKALIEKIDNLKSPEYETAKLLLHSYSNEVSEREICRQNEIPHTTFLSRKEKIFEKFKKSFDQNG